MALLRLVFDTAALHTIVANSRNAPEGPKEIKYSIASAPEWPKMMQAWLSMGQPLGVKHLVGMLSANFT